MLNILVKLNILVDSTAMIKTNSARPLLNSLSVRGEERYRENNKSSSFSSVISPKRKCSKCGNYHSTLGGKVDSISKIFICVTCKGK